MGIERFEGRIAGGKHHHENIRSWQVFIDLFGRNHRESGALPRALCNAGYVRTESLEEPRCLLPDRAESPHKHIGIKQGCDLVFRVKFLRAAELLSPTMLDRCLRQRRQEAYKVQGQRERMFRNGLRVQTHTCTDGGIWGESRRTYRIRPRKKRLNKPHIFHAASGIRELIGGIRPSNQNFGIGIFLGNRFRRVVMPHGIAGFKP